VLCVVSVLIGVTGVLAVFAAAEDVAAVKQS